MYSNNDSNGQRTKFVTLTDKLVKDSVRGVWLWNVVIRINYSQLRRVLKRMLIEAE